MRLARAAAVAALLLTGCQGYRIVQQNVFVDDDGNVVVVDYGRSETDHENSFVSPVTGKRLAFRSRLMVRVRLPDGDTFRAWQCMTKTRGTMYATDDGEWKALAKGFSFIVYRLTDEEPPRYLEVFRGVLCDTPEIDVKKDDRWRELQGNGREYRKDKPEREK